MEKRAGDREKGNKREEKEQETAIYRERLLELLEMQMEMKPAIQRLVKVLLEKAGEPLLVMNNRQGTVCETATASDTHQSPQQPC